MRSMCWACRGLRFFVVGAVVAACLVAGPVGTAAAAYRVDYTLGKILTSLEPRVSPAGANNWGCKPSAARPQPVILVHGWAANQHDNWYTLSPLLANNGYCVFTFNYGGPAQVLPWVYGIGTMQESAAELAAFVDRVRAATGAAEVDLVGHSLGATMPHYYLKHMGGTRKVDDFVGLAPVVKGTSLWGIATIGTFFGVTHLAGLVIPVIEQLGTGSPFLRELSAGGITRPGVRYTTIVSRYDELVTPYWNGQLPSASNVTNRVVQRSCIWDFAAHVGIAFSPNALRLVLNALDPANARSSCRFVPTIF